MSPSNPRRWLQFRLRTLLISVTLAALPLGYVAWEREQCRRGEEALDRLNKNPEIHIMRLWAEGENRPDWLTIILGADTFRKVDTASLVGDSVSDSDLRLLVMLPNLTWVEIDAKNVTDEGISHLRSLKSVEDLYITSNRKVAHKSWEVLSELRELHSLSLRGSQFGDEDVQRLLGLSDLTALDLSGTNITDSGLEELSSLINLTHLQLPSTKISDAGLVHLKKLTNLRDVSLGNTKVTRAGALGLKRSLPNAYISRIDRESDR